MNQSENKCYGIAIFNFDQLTARTPEHELIDLTRERQSLFVFKNKIDDYDYLKDHHALGPNEALIKVIYDVDGIIKDVNFIDIELERFKPLLDPKSIECRRDKERGKPLSDAMGKRQVTIIRATDERTKTFKGMDYVMFYDGVINPNTYRIIERYLDDEADLMSQQQKIIGWVASHAQTMSVCYGENHHVLLLRVSTADIYEATNPGEYFYDGEIAEGKIAFKLDSLGCYQEPIHKNEYSL